MSMEKASEVYGEPFRMAFMACPKHGLQTVLAQVQWAGVSDMILDQSPFTPKY